MEGIDGVLCETCRRSFQGENDIESRDRLPHFPHRSGLTFNIYHHTTFQAFQESVSFGCFVCIWIWEHLESSIPHTDHAGASRLKEDFRIYCRMWGVENADFYVKCNWVDPSKFHISIAQKSQYTGVWHHLETQPWSKISGKVGSTQELQLIEKWASFCEANHQHCRPAGHKFFPTRILDVGATDSESGNIRLQHRNDITTESLIPLQGHSRQYPPYWTLSHRWGNQDILKLCVGTEDKFRQGIPLSSLSPTFRDAILLVRRLGHRYIWIDSLCIIQDSRADWQKEASAMADIYSHSYCNISAIGASHSPSTTGLFDPPQLSPRLLQPHAVSIPLKDRNSGMIDGPWLVWNDAIWESDIENSPLSSRGWVVQERFLSPRIIHFTPNQIYWECLESIRCSSDPEGKLLSLGTKERRCLETTNYKSSRLELAQAAPAPSRPGEHPQYLHHRHWGAMVSIYIGCHLTEESDRFIAMSGIAKAFRQVKGDTYLAGLWKRTLHTDLSWETSACRGTQTRRNRAYAPSWSWVSIVGDHVGLNIPRNKFSNLPVSLVRLVGERIVPDPPEGDSTGLLQSAELDIECMIYHYRWTGSSKTVSVYSDKDLTHQYTEISHGSGDFKLDTSDLVRKFEDAENIEGVCIPVFGVYEGYGGGHNKFLVLEPHAKNVYKRIGIFRVGGIGRWIDSWSGQGSTITLV
ncbi:unnamed protein product [Clonostachys rosea]|uniref:Heterokaryon incompatibility domain-containing protein n=1 Tax=Bionectria ochroleuca TaxID=29856 RepID=A0ABY6TNA2_BIOOC|nr:unnamed protein product [Clonostachys rosea]